jgi:hypothetical protein
MADTTAYAQKNHDSTASRVIGLNSILDRRSSILYSNVPSSRIASKSLVSFKEPTPTRPPATVERQSMPKQNSGHDGERSADVLREASVVKSDGTVRTSVVAIESLTFSRQAANVVLFRSLFLISIISESVSVSASILSPINGPEAPPVEPDVKPAPLPTPPEPARQPAPSPFEPEWPPGRTLPQPKANAACRL